MMFNLVFIGLFLVQIQDPSTVEGEIFQKEYGFFEDVSPSIPEEEYGDTGGQELNSFIEDIAQPTIAADGDFDFWEPYELTESMMPPEFGMTRIYFSESSKAPKRRKVLKRPHLISIPSLNMSCEQPCFLDVPMGAMLEIAFHSPRGIWTTSFRFDEPEVDLQLVREGDDAKYWKGVTLLSIGAPLTAVGASMLIITVASLFRTGNIYTLLAGIVTAATGIPLTVVGATFVRKNRGKIIKYDGYIKNEKISIEETIQESFHYSVLPTKDGFAAGVGFRF